MGRKKAEKEKNQNIQVAVRCRPLNSTEKRNGSYSVVDLNPDRREVNIRDRLPTSGTKTFTYDRVFGPKSEQIEVYQSMVVPILEEVLQGYNCTMFAYGQTGTGKTFTMEGDFTDDPAFCWDKDPNIGIIPRSMGHLFHRLNNMECEYSVRVSYLEIYNEELMDLLGAEAVENPRLKIYEDTHRKGSCIIHGLEEAVVQDCTEVYRILQQGSTRRQTASTLMNARSSRSHSVFMVTVHMKENSVDGDEMLKIGKLNLVDLAGSECIGRSGAVDKRAREAGNINQSLLTLGRVITALVERASHVPYRESKLTRLLQDSLGGKTKTSIIATVSPASCNIEETMSTLDYAYRAKNITNRPEVNQKLTKRTLMKGYNEEIERLRRDLQAARDKNGIFLAEENYTAMTTKIAQQTDSIKDFEERVAALDADYLQLSGMFTMTKEDLEERTHQLQETEQLLRVTESSLRRTRTDRDEQKHLVGKHLEGETQLFTEAKQLLTTADESTADVQGLHAKLDRKRTVESLNETVQQTFQRSFKNCTDAMADEITVTTAQQTEQVSDMQTMLREMLCKRGDEATTLKSSLSEFNASMTEQMTAARERFLAAVVNGQSHCSELTSSVTKAKDEELCRQFAFLEETFKSKMENLQDKTTTALTNVQDFGSILQAQFDAQLTKLKSVESDLLQRLERQQALVSKFSNELGRSLEDHTSDTVSMMKAKKAEEKAITSEVLYLLHKLSQVSEDNHDAVVEKAQLVQCKQLQATFVSDATCNVSDMKSTVQAETEQWKDLSQEQSQIAQAKIANFGRQLEGVVEQEAGVQTDAAHFCQESVQILENNTSAALEMIANHVTSLDEMRERQVEMSRTCCSDHEEKTSALRESVDANNRRLEQDVQSHVAALSDHAENLTAKSAHHKEQLAARHVDVENFLVQDLKKDVPTGATPPRRDFKYPVKLTQTDRHSLLLSAFREQYVLEEAVNTPIPDDTLSESVHTTQLDMDHDEDVSNVSSDSALSSASTLSSASGLSVRSDLDKLDDKENCRMRPPTRVPQRQVKPGPRSNSNPRQPLRSRSPTPQRRATPSKAGFIPHKGTEDKVSRPAVKS